MFYGISPKNHPTTLHDSQIQKHVQVGIISEKIRFYPFVGNLLGTQLEFN